MVEYRYELRRGEEIIATGHLALDESLAVGERIAIGARLGIVRSVGRRAVTGRLGEDDVSADEIAETMVWPSRFSGVSAPSGLHDPAGPSFKDGASLRITRRQLLRPVGTSAVPRNASTRAQDDV